MSVSGITRPAYSAHAAARQCQKHPLAGAVFAHLAKFCPCRGLSNLL